ncbi:MAG: hypothetical protein MUF11_15325 [Beijerinckiaceae bacterium]|nr:hypothetical protein [Beijerinckiaceae bacterium]
MPKRNHDHSAQAEAFIEAAHALECDESEKRFNEALGKIARHKPKPDKPPEKTPETEDKKPAK